jgi:uncharacterized protein YggT (Ycf19 family)
MMTDETNIAQEPGTRRPTTQQAAQLRRAKRVIYFIVNTVATLIALRFLLKALGADPTNPFAQFLFMITYPFVAPFVNLFGAPPTYGNNVFEFGDLFGIFIYYLLAWFVIRVTTFIVTRPAE